MIKVFTTGKDGKINLTAKELKELLDEAYWEGYRANSHTYTYTTPTWKPFTISTTCDNSTDQFEYRSDKWRFICGRQRDN